VRPPISRGGNAGTVFHLRRGVAEDNHRKGVDYVKREETWERENPTAKNGGGGGVAHKRGTGKKRGPSGIRYEK